MNKRLELIIHSIFIYVVLVIVARIVFALFLDVLPGESLICPGWYTVDERPCGLFEFIYTNPKNRIMMIIGMAGVKAKIIFLIVNIFGITGVYFGLKKLSNRKKEK